MADRCPHCGSGVLVGGSVTRYQCGGTTRTPGDRRTKLCLSVTVARTTQLVRELLSCPQVERVDGQYVEMMVPADLLREIEQVAGVSTCLM